MRQPLNDTVGLAGRDGKGAVARPQRDRQYSFNYGRSVSGDSLHAAAGVSTVVCSLEATFNGAVPVTNVGKETVPFDIIRAIIVHWGDVNDIAISHRHFYWLSLMQRTDK